MMSGIRGKNTRPEIVIRSGLHRLGFRYQLHRKDLPGRPDLVFPKYGAAVFVNGCFWHRHDCHLFKWPETRPEFWRRKIAGNIERDRMVSQALTERGWRFLVIWECSLKGRTRLNADELVARVARWLRDGDRAGEIRGTA